MHEAGYPRCYPGAPCGGYASIGKCAPGIAEGGIQISSRVLAHRAEPEVRVSEKWIRFSAPNDALACVTVKDRPDVPWLAGVRGEECALGYGFEVMVHGLCREAGVAGTQRVYDLAVFVDGAIRRMGATVECQD